MDVYQKRSLSYHGKIMQDTWQIKVYLMSHKSSFESWRSLEAAITELPNWLEKSTENDFEHYHLGYLIVHEAREATIAILSWWTGENMVQNHVFFADYDQPKFYVDKTHLGIRFCVWELEVMWEERNYWIKHVLQNNDQPDYEAYLSEYYQAVSVG